MKKISVIEGRVWVIAVVLRGGSRGIGEYTMKNPRRRGKVGIRGERGDWGIIGKWKWELEGIVELGGSWCMY